MAPTKAVTLAAAAALSAPQNAAAWDDHGHMLMAAVAKEHLSDAIKAKVDAALTCSDGPGELASEFSAFNGIESAAVWLDRVECPPQGRDAPQCAGLGPMVSTRLFEAFQFQRKPYNPNNIELPIGDIGYDYWEEYTENALTTISESFASWQDESLNEVPSPWGLSTQMRIFLNLFGLVNQPNHMGTMYDSQAFSGEQGDYNGQFLRCGGSACMEAGNMAMFWSKGCGALVDHFDDLTEGEMTMHGKAQTLMAEFPADSFIGTDGGFRLNADWNNEEASFGMPEDVSDFINGAATDSFEVLASLYEEYLANASRDRYFFPDEAYITKCQTITKQQIAVGGYRMSSWLNHFAQYLPDTCTGEEPPVHQTTTMEGDEGSTTTQPHIPYEDNDKYLWGVVGLVIGLMIGSGGALCFLTKGESGGDASIALAAPTEA